MFAFRQTCGGAGCSYCGIHHFGVTQGCNFLLCHQDGVTGGAMLAFRQTCGGAGCSYCSIHYFGVTQCRNQHLSRDNRVTDFTLTISAQAARGTSGGDTAHDLNLVTQGSYECILIAITTDATSVEGVACIGTSRSYHGRLVGMTGYALSHGFTVQFLAATATVYYQVIAAGIIVIRRNLVFLHRIGFLVTATDHLGGTAHFRATECTVDNLFIAAVISTSSGDFVFCHGFRSDMLQSRGFICGVTIATTGTGVRGVTSSGTSSFGHHCLVAMANRINGLGLTAHFLTTDRTVSDQIVATGGGTTSLYAVLFLGLTGDMLHCGRFDGLAIQLCATDATVDHQIVAARFTALSGDSVLLHRSGFLMAGRLDGLGLAAQLFMADATVSSLIIAASNIAGCVDLVFDHDLTRGVIQLCGFIGNQHITTDCTALGGIAGSATGRRGDDTIIIGVTQCIHADIFTADLHMADSTVNDGIVATDVDTIGLDGVFNKFIAIGVTQCLTIGHATDTTGFGSVTGCGVHLVAECSCFALNQNGVTLGICTHQIAGIAVAATIQQVFVHQLGVCVVATAAGNSGKLSIAAIGLGAQCGNAAGRIVLIQCVEHHIFCTGNGGAACIVLGSLVSACHGLLYPTDETVVANIACGRQGHGAEVGLTGVCQRVIRHDEADGVTQSCDGFTTGQDFSAGGADSTGGGTGFGSSGSLVGNHFHAMARCHLVAGVGIATDATSPSGVADGGTSGGSYLGFVIVTQNCHSAIHIAEATDATGVGGIAGAGTSGFGHLGLIVMFCHRGSVGDVCITTSRTGPGGITGGSTGCCSYCRLIIVSGSGYERTNITVVTSGAAVSSVTTFRTGGCSHGGFVGMTLGRADSDTGIGHIAALALGRFRTISGTGCIIVGNVIYEAMSQSANSVIHIGVTTDTTGVGGITSGGTGGFGDDGFIGMAQSGHSAIDIGVTTNATSVGTVASGGTSRFGNNGFIAMTQRIANRVTTFSTGSRGGTIGIGIGMIAYICLATNITFVVAVALYIGAIFQDSATAIVTDMVVIISGVGVLTHILLTSITSVILAFIRMAQCRAFLGTRMGFITAFALGSFRTISSTSCILVEDIVHKAMSQCGAGSIATLATGGRLGAVCIIIAVGGDVFLAANITIVVAIAIYIGTCLQNCTTAVVTDMVLILRRIGMITDGLGTAIVTSVILIFVLMLTDLCTTLITNMVLLSIYTLGQNFVALTIVTDVVAVALGILVFTDGFGTAIITFMILVLIAVVADICSTFVTSVILVLVDTLSQNFVALTIVTDVVAVALGILVFTDGLGTAIITLVILVFILMLTDGSGTAIVTLMVLVGIDMLTHIGATSITSVVLIFIRMAQHTNRIGFIAVATYRADIAGIAIFRTSRLYYCAFIIMAIGRNRFMANNIGSTILTIDTVGDAGFCTSGLLSCYIHRVLMGACHSNSYCRQGHRNLLPCHFANCGNTLNQSKRQRILTQSSILRDLDSEFQQNTFTIAISARGVQNNILCRCEGKERIAERISQFRFSQTSLPCPTLGLCLENRIELNSRESGILLYNQGDGGPFSLFGRYRVCRNDQFSFFYCKCCSAHKHHKHRQHQCHTDYSFHAGNLLTQTLFYQKKVYFSSSQINISNKKCE